ncbi:MAG: AAA family ATPase, partial [Verrucomicrobiota bacterium]
MKVNLSKLLRAKLRVLLVGKPGLAKTARVLEAAREAGYRTVIFRTSLSERVDLGGCLVPDVAAGVTVALPLQLLADLKKASDKVLVFLDDLGQAPMDVQAATMSLFDKGTLPENVVIWGATNRPGDKAGVTSLCEPLRSRFHVAFAIAS